MSNFALGPLGGSSGVETSLLRDLIAETREISMRPGISEGEYCGISIVIDMLERRLATLVEDNERAFQEILARGKGSV